MKTYSIDEAQIIVNKKIKESVKILRRELRDVNKTSFALTLKPKPPRAYVSRSV